MLLFEVRNLGCKIRILCDPTLESYLPPNDAQVVKNLSSKITREGFTESIKVWDENGYLVDGHTRVFRVLPILDEDVTNNLSLSLCSLSFESLNEVKKWMWLNQQESRRNLTANKATNWYYSEAQKFLNSSLEEQKEMRKGSIYDSVKYAYGLDLLPHIFEESQGLFYREEILKENIVFGKKSIINWYYSQLPEMQKLVNVKSHRDSNPRLPKNIDKPLQKAESKEIFCLMAYGKLSFSQASKIIKCKLDKIQVLSKDESKKEVQGLIVEVTVLGRIVIDEVAVNADTLIIPQEKSSVIPQEKKIEDSREETIIPSYPTVSNDLRERSQTYIDSSTPQDSRTDNDSRSSYRSFDDFGEDPTTTLSPEKERALSQVTPLKACQFSDQELFEAIANRPKLRKMLYGTTNKFAEFAFREIGIEAIANLSPDDFTYIVKKILRRRNFFRRSKSVFFR